MESTFVPARYPGARARRFRGKLFVATARTGYELNELGEYAYSRIDGRRTVAELAQDITTEFDVDYDTALADCVEFLESLQEAGILAGGD